MTYLLNIMRQRPFTAGRGTGSEKGRPAAIRARKRPQATTRETLPQKKGFVILREEMEESPEYKNLSSYGKNIVKKARERFSCQIETILSLKEIIEKEDLKRYLEETQK